MLEPIISAAEWPNSRSAAAFQVLTVPSRVRLRMASSDVSTIAARSRMRSCAIFAAVTSRPIVVAPTTFPCASRIGEIVSETSITVPSLRSRFVSK